MSKKAVVNVDFIAEYKGAANLKRAESDLHKLNSSLKTLGKTFGLVFGARELMRFGKDSVKAFAEQQRNMALLNNTLQNLGKSYATVSTDAFLRSIELASGKTDDELIPAFQGLLIATNDVKSAQDALKIALDVSAGTGKDLHTVQVALSKAYLGNTTGLTRLGAGLKKSILDTKDMTLINKELVRVFKGDLAVSVDSIGGKFDRLNVALNQSKENIGQGLVAAFGALAGSQDFDKTLEKIIDFSTKIERAIIMVGRLGKLISLEFGNPLDNILGKTFSKQLDLLDQFEKEDAKARRQFGGIYATQYQAIAAKKIATDKAVSDKAALDAANKLKKAAADKLALERASLALKLGGQTVDMQNIEIQAALQRGQSDQVVNVLLLQRAIINGNADQVIILSEEVLKANGLVMDVNGNISSLAQAKNPFGDWPTATQTAMNQLKAIQDALALIKDKAITISVKYFMENQPSSPTAPVPPSNPLIPNPPTIIIPTPPILPPSGTGSKPPQFGVGGQPIYPGDSGYVYAPDSNASIDATMIPPAGVTSNNPGNGADARYDQKNPVIINITAPANTVVETTQAASTNGTSVIVNRNNPFE